jgi:hypothetical protein
MPISLRDALFWAAVACCAVATLAILRSVIAPAPARGDLEAGGERAAAPVTRRAIEIAYAAIPALVLALVLAATWREVHASRSSAGAGDAPAPAAPRS